MVSHSDCHSVVKEAWHQNFVGCPMVILSQKLKALKMKLKDWNIQVFGNVNHQVQSAMQSLNVIQEQIDQNGFNEDLLKKEKDA